MYKHIVLWKLKEQADGKSRKELAIEVKRRLDELPGLIPEIVSYETGINNKKIIHNYLLTIN